MPAGDHLQLRGGARGDPDFDPHPRTRVDIGEDSKGAKPLVIAREYPVVKPAPKPDSSEKPADDDTSSSQLPSPPGTQVGSAVSTRQGSVVSADDEPTATNKAGSSSSNPQGSAQDPPAKKPNIERIRELLAQRRFAKRKDSKGE